MLSPRLTNCPECSDISSLLKKIDCKLAELGNNLYNNISYMLNKPVPAGDITQLITYRRILLYKLCNPSYVQEYTIPMISSRVIRLTVGCVSRCNTPEPCIEEPCDITIVPNPTTTTSSSSTTTSTTIAPTTTSTSTTAVPTTTTTSSSSSTSTSTSTSSTSTSTSSSSTTTTSSSTTTTTTTIACFSYNITIEQEYIDLSSSGEVTVAYGSCPDGKSEAIFYTEAGIYPDALCAVNIESITGYYIDGSEEFPFSVFPVLSLNPCTTTTTTTTI